jgi:galactokinase
MTQSTAGSPTARDRALAACPGAEVVARAPGRANLIGEHTDYNGGLVLPIALDLSTYVAGRRAGKVRLTSLHEPGEVVVDTVTGEGPAAGWGLYVAAVVRALLEAGHRPDGIDGVVASDVPLGAGLSSSAALEVAVATALAPRLKGIELARICQRAENHFVGVASGLMDQLSSVSGRAGNALLIDCRSYEIELIPVPSSVAVLVIDSGVRRDLATSGYNDRGRECRDAAAALGVETLRDASMADLDRLAAEPVLLRRARHVITENDRVVATAAALRASRPHELTAIWHESHRSYSADFDASTPEIDELVRAAENADGVVASRLTGGGFGGCTVHLVVADRAEAAALSILDRYRAAVGIEARRWITVPSAGAELERPA